MRTRDWGRIWGRFMGPLIVLSLYLSVSTAYSDPYYQGKTITIIVSSSPGGGTDTTARLASSFLPKYLPGNPDIIVQNVPGGGGITANNFFAATAKPDGLTLLQGSGGNLANFMRGGSRIKHDPRKYRVIGGVTRGGNILVVRKAVRDRLTDDGAEKLVVGDGDGIRPWVAMTVWAAKYADWNLRWLYGYAGTSELLLALRQGEIDVWGTMSAKMLRDLEKEGVADLLFVQAAERRPDFPNIPTFAEFLQEQRPSGISWEAYRVWAAPDAEVDKYLVAPEGTPDSIVADLRTAYLKLGKDPEFMKQARAVFGDAVQVRSGEEVESTIKAVTEVSEETKRFLKEMRENAGLPTG